MVPQKKLTVFPLDTSTQSNSTALAFHGDRHIQSVRQLRFGCSELDYHHTGRYRRLTLKKRMPTLHHEAIGGQSIQTKGPFKWRVSRHRGNPL